MIARAELTIWRVPVRNVVMPLLMLVGGVVAGEASMAPTIIRMEGSSPYYLPFEARVTPGSPIQWVNPTASPHTIRHDGCVKEGPCAFDSGAVEPNGRFMIPALSPGRYPYHCELHPIMRGVVVVGDRVLLTSEYEERKPLAKASCPAVLKSGRHFDRSMSLGQCKAVALRHAE